MILESIVEIFRLFARIAQCKHSVWTDRTFQAGEIRYGFTSHLVVSEPSVRQSEANGAALLFEFSVALDERLQRWKGGGCGEMKNDREDEECRVNKSALPTHARTDLFWRHKHKRGNKCRDVTGIVSLLAATRKPGTLTQ